MIFKSARGPPSWIGFQDGHRLAAVLLISLWNWYLYATTDVNIISKALKTISCRPTNPLTTFSKVTNASSIFAVCNIVMWATRVRVYKWEGRCCTRRVFEGVSNHGNRHRLSSWEVSHLFFLSLAGFHSRRSNTNTIGNGLACRTGRKSWKLSITTTHTHVCTY